MSKAATYERIETHPPTELEPSEYHIRGKTEVSENLTKSVQSVGIINPPLARYEDGEVRIIDGMRRTTAAAHANKDKIPVLILTVDDTDALAIAIGVHAPQWTKTVSTSDREAALMELATGDRKQPPDSDIVVGYEDHLVRAREKLGISSKHDKFSHAFGDITGIGDAAITNLTDAFETTSDVEDATVEELTNVSGIGPVLAERIHQSTSETSSVVEHEIELTDE